MNTSMNIVHSNPHFGITTFVPNSPHRLISSVSVHVSSYTIMYVIFIWTFPKFGLKSFSGKHNSIQHCNFILKFHEFQWNRFYVRKRAWKNKSLVDQ